MTGDLDGGYTGSPLAEEERKRIAEGLHDGPIQWLASASLQVATMRRLEEPDTGRLESIEEILGRAIASLRRMMFSLYPPEIDDTDLETGLQVLVDWILSDSDLRADVEIDLERPIESQALRNAVVRLVQEAVTNAKVHAAASELRVSIVEREGVVEVCVADDGVGFDPESAVGRPGHLGLRMMRERAESAGGSLGISTAVGSGTTVLADLPRT